MTFENTCETQPNFTVTLGKATLANWVSSHFSTTTRELTKKRKGERGLAIHFTAFV